MRDIVCATLIGAIGSSVAAQVDATARVVPGQIIVCPEPGRDVELMRTIEARGLRVLETIPTCGTMLLSSPEGREDELVAEFGEFGGVRYAERNALGQGGLVPTDPFFDRQWHLQNTGQAGGVPGADIGATTAWDIETGSSSIVIAVLDSGILENHPDFVGRIRGDGFDFVNEDSSPNADHPHGTWVTGCIAANANNDFGIVGVDLACEILPVKVLNASNSGTTFDLGQGLAYAAMNPEVDIISLSLINYPGSSTVRNGLQMAADAGKILIACAGNNGEGNADVSWPGASPLTITIGATTRSDNRADFSGTGSALDFVAPGQSIATSRNTFANGFDILSGCSFATPITAGVAGLMLAYAERLGRPFGQDEVYEYLRIGAADEVGPISDDPPGRDDFFGHGRIDAAATLTAMQRRFDCNDNGLNDSIEIIVGTLDDIDNDDWADDCDPCASIADFTGDNELSFFDAQVFLAAFAQGTLNADLTGDGVLDFFDVQAFLEAFSRGC